MQQTRLIRRAGTKVTAYLPGGQELTLDTTAQTLSAVRYYTFAGKTIATRTGTGFAGVTTLIPDTQGTALESVANTTNVTTRRWADPFGGSRGTPTGAWTGDRGFLNKVTDATGLTAVGARYYDPGIGRFISVDPVMDRSDPQQWTGYTYSDNNPITLSDPSGLLPSWNSVWNSVKSAAKSTGKWVNTHQSQIAGAVAGVVVTAGCLAITAGAGSILCAAAGGAAAGAVTNLWASQVAHTQTFSWKSLAFDTVVGGVVGAATGALGKVAAPLLSKAGSAIAGAARTALSRAAPAVRQAAAAVTRTASNTARAALRSDSGAAEASVVVTERTAVQALKPSEAVPRWDEFLGEGPTTNLHPRTGLPDSNRIVSSDGLRSIRFGPHEMGSSPTKFHFHEETWSFDSGSNSWLVDNVLVRVPFPKGAW